MVEYAISLKNVHYEKGSIWEYNQIVLSDDSWVPHTIEFADQPAPLAAVSAKTPPAAETPVALIPVAEIQADQQVTPAAFAAEPMQSAPPSRLRRLPPVE